MIREQEGYCGDPSRVLPASRCCCESTAAHFAPAYVRYLVGSGTLASWKASLRSLQVPHRPQWISPASSQVRVSEPLDRLPLHRVERLNELWAAVGIDVVITSVYGCGHERSAPCNGNAVGNGEHDGVAIGNYGNGHVLGGVVAVGHFDIVG